MKVESREYKLLVAHQPFADPRTALEAVWEEIQEAAETLPAIRVKGQLDERESRTVRFLDTAGSALRRQGLVLRQRTNAKTVEYTLKCRSEDRYFAAGTDVSAASGLKGKPKLEEDIAPAFRCRFSHSTTVTISGKGKGSGRRTPASLHNATLLFPILGTLSDVETRLGPKTPLETVNNIVVSETVWQGGKIVFQAEEAEANKATVALILWRRGQEARPAIAELSFRIKDRDENFSRDLAKAARSAYEAWQRLDCAQVVGMTKTEYIYRDGSRD